ncbi:MAG: preprotein translocase subunit SecA [Clostridia bacterium]|nr:preprotein translocase subunit SecA [Clostridia bacterium]
MERDMGLFGSLFGSYSEKQIKKIKPTVDKIEALAPKYSAMSDAELRAMTDIFKKRLAEGQTLDDILPDAYAVVREADWRVLGKRPFNVQLIGAVILHQGRIAEMKTGEGKTLVATMPAYLNALSGKGVHIVTVNEYLARRDMEEMGKVYSFLGLTVGLLTRTYDKDEKRKAYAADITYGMNSEFGFDYLRDNLVKSKDDEVARGYDFAIVDEVDSILIDEARTPLIITAPSGKSTSLYQKTDKLVRTMRAKVMTKTDSKEDYNSFEEHFIHDEGSGYYLLMRESLKRFTDAFSADAECDLVSLTEGIALTKSGRDGLMARSFSDEDFISADGEGEEFLFTESGKRRAEPYLNEVITESARGDVQSLTEHGRDKLIKFFDFDEKMFIDDGEGAYSIIAKAKGHVIKNLSLSESDFAAYERNFVVNDKAKVASFLELGKKNACLYHGFCEEHFLPSPMGSGFILSDSGKEHITALFKLGGSDLTQAKGGGYFINRQAILRIKELFSRNYIINERTGEVTPTALGMSRIATVFELEEGKDYKTDASSTHPMLTKSGKKILSSEYSFEPSMTDKHGSVYCLTSRGVAHLTRFSELDTSCFSESDSLFALNDSGIREIKRIFSLTERELELEVRSAHLTFGGASKLTEAFDLGSRAAVLIGRRSDSYVLTRGAVEDLCERLSISRDCFAQAEGEGGYRLLDGAIDAIKRALTFVETADFIYKPKIGYLTEDGVRRLEAIFSLEDGFTECEGGYIFNKSALGALKRITAINELYTPLLLTKGGVEKLRSAINFDYIVNEKNRTATLTKIGIGKVEKYFDIDNVADDDNQELLHHVNVAISAYGTMKRDVHYIVVKGQVYIVDQSTGRVLEGRRFSDGLHQAIEAKEGVEIRAENRTTATVSYQNFFRMYRKLSGMTGTALTEQNEFREIYSLDVVEVPTNRPVIRKDHTDIIFKTKRGKLNAILSRIAECYKKGQPVLVGTTSVEKSEELSQLLRRERIPHNVLNAKEHSNEATLIASAGMPGAVTISTNMAGRGTDIMLGGNPAIHAKNKLRSYLESQGRYRALGKERLAYLVSVCDSATELEDEDVREVRAKYQEILAQCEREREPLLEKVRAAGGLFVIGAERHDSRRIDNQLRGRSGRQGDVGESVFYSSLEDDLLRFFGEKITGMLTAVGLDENMPLQFSILASRIEDAQKRVESRHFQSRKHVLSYDDVMNEQRKVVYEMRKSILALDDIRPKIEEIIEKCVGEQFDACFGLSEDADRTPEDFEGIFKGALKLECDGEDELTPEDKRERYIKRALDIYEAKTNAAKSATVVPISGVTSTAKEVQDALASLTHLAFLDFQRTRLLDITDKCWMSHLDQMEDLKSYVGLNSFAQRNPLTVYQLEGAQMFSEMMKEIRLKTTLDILTRPIDMRMIGRSRSAHEKMKQFSMTELKQRPSNELSLNAPCPCGSGKKYKRCCYMKDKGAKG